MLRYDRDDRVLVKNTGTSDIPANSLVKVGNWVGVASIRRFTPIRWKRWCKALRLC